jgi:hypothetical protein
MDELKGRALIESLFGPLGQGAQFLNLDGTEYSLWDLLCRMGLNFDDSRPIDVQTVAQNCYVVRYYDGQDQRVVAQEFDSEMRFLREYRAHIAEWVGEQAYFSFFSGH